jgi:hypothetical protein
MSKIDETLLDAPHHENLQKLRAEAAQLHEQNPYKIAGEDYRSATGPSHRP